jgi:hypothetical protein
MRLRPLARSAALVLLAPVLLVADVSHGPPATSASNVRTTTVARPVPEPATTFAVGSEAFNRAVAIAEAQWGRRPCGGDVSYSWAVLPDLVNGRATWTNPGTPWGNPATNRACHIALNAVAPFDWPMFCTVVAHEMGHLLGLRDEPDPGTLMSGVYTAPLAACAEPPPAAVTAVAPVAARAARPRRVVRRRCVITRRHGRVVRHCVVLKKRRRR